VSKKSPRPHRPKEKWSAADKRAALRTWVDTDSLRETARQTGVPLGTLADWIDDPDNAAVIEHLRTAHVREMVAEDNRIAREAAAGVREGVAVCRGLLGRRRKVIDRAGNERIELLTDGKEAAALTKALVAVRADVDRRTRLDTGRPTDRVELVADEAAALDDELRGLLAKPHVRKALAQLGKA
jgi:transposase-like protein